MTRYTDQDARSTVKSIFGVQGHYHGAGLVDIGQVERNSATVKTSSSELDTSSIWYCDVGPYSALELASKDGRHRVDNIVEGDLHCVDCEIRRNGSSDCHSVASGAAAEAGCGDVGDDHGQAGGSGGQRVLGWEGERDGGA